MRVVVIGATGHIGGYLVPRLVSSGHDVVVVEPRTSRTLSCDQILRGNTSRESSSIARAKRRWAHSVGPRVAALNPDVVIDLVCFTPEEAEELVSGIRGARATSCELWNHLGCTARLQQYRLMTDADLSPWGDYGVDKLKIERLPQRRVEDALVAFPLSRFVPGHASPVQDGPSSTRSATPISVCGNSLLAARK